MTTSNEQHQTLEQKFDAMKLDARSIDVLDTDCEWKGCEAPKGKMCNFAPDHEYEVRFHTEERLKKAYAEFHEKLFDKFEDMMAEQYSEGQNSMQPF